jgi:pyridoxine 5-phosphate synthase
VVDLCRVALDNGSVGITVHPRPDERHIRRTDVADISRLLRADYPGREFNIEGYPDERFLSLCEAEKPEQVTLVPDDPSQGTSDHGWDIAAHQALLARVIGELHEGGMRVSIFVDADPAAALLARQVGADRVELYTGPYGSGAAGELAKLKATGEAARECGLGLNAGHDLTRANLPPLVQALPFLQEVSIGHALTADCLTFGMAETVRLYLKALSP